MYISHIWFIWSYLKDGNTSTVLYIFRYKSLYSFSISLHSQPLTTVTEGSKRSIPLESIPDCVLILKIIFLIQHVYTPYVWWVRFFPCVWDSVLTGTLNVLRCPTVTSVLLTRFPNCHSLLQFFLGLGGLVTYILSFITLNTKVTLSFGTLQDLSHYCSTLHRNFLI